MKAIRWLLVISFVFVAFSAVGGASAQAFTYTSGFQLQNLDPETATVSIVFYNQDGSIEASVPDSVPGNGSKTYFPLTVTDGFNGSVVISSDKRVAAIGNILGDGGLAAASYSAATEGSTNVQIPLLMKNNSGYNTWFNVQNTGASDASVTVNYSDGTTNSATIKPGAAYTFNQATETHPVTVFSAIVESNVPIAASVIEENPDVMFAYSGFASGSTNPVMPLINANNSGYQTGVQIQNVGDVQTSVTVSYTPTDGTACTETQTIPAKSSKTFALAAFANGANSNCIPLARFVGSAEVSVNSANQPLVAIVNQLRAGLNGEAYGAFDPAAANETVVMPLIMDRNGGYFTGFNIMNVGSTSTTVNCSFTGTTYTVSGALNPGQALNALQLGQIANAYVGSGTCTAGTGAQIVGVVNELGSSSTSDQLLTYEGVNP